MGPIEQAKPELQEIEIVYMGSRIEHFAPNC